MKYWTVAVAILLYAWIHVYFKRLTAGLVLKRGHGFDISSICIGSLP